MFEALSRLVKSKEGKQAAMILGVTVLTLTALHYYNQIKLTRLKIREMEEDQEKKDTK